MASSPRPLRAALYARVSTTGHGQDVGLQLDELRQVAQQRGLVLAGEYIDEGVSGIKVSRAPASTGCSPTRRPGASTCCWSGSSTASAAASSTSSPCWTR